MSFSSKISKKNSGAVLLGTFVVPAAFSAASQNVSAVGNNTAQTAQSSLDVSDFLKKYGKETLVAVLAVFALGGIVAAIYYFINKRVVHFGDVFTSEEEELPEESEDKGVLTQKDFVNKFEKYVGAVYKVKKDDLRNICDSYSKEKISEKIGNLDLVARIVNISHGGYLDLCLLDTEGNVVRKSVCTKSIPKDIDMNKVNELVKQLEQCDISVDVLGNVRSAFYREGNKISEKEYKKLLPLVGGAFKIKGKDVIGISLDLLNDDVIEDIKNNRMNDDFTIVIRSLSKEGSGTVTLRYDLFDEKKILQYRVGSCGLINDVNKIEGFVNYLKDRDVSVNTLGLFGSAFGSGSSIECVEKGIIYNKIKLLENCAYKVKGRDIINIADRKDKVIDINENDEYIIVIDPLQEDCRLSLDVLDTNGDELIERVITNYATPDINKIDALVEYLEKNKIDINSLKKTGNNMVEMSDDD